MRNIRAPDGCLPSPVDENRVVVARKFAVGVSVRLSEQSAVFVNHEAAHLTVGLFLAEQGRGAQVYHQQRQLTAAGNFVPHLLPSLTEHLTAIVSPSHKVFAGAQGQTKIACDAHRQAQMSHRTWGDSQRKFAKYPSPSKP